ncbi:hypothetical protein CYMTET_30772 [Cymbomonas tetramitiformis]|uniref:Uncharacterized protein n=1 Tax=Cymbomonas tetramitiformis TaxID=36881 RepID=A0AAE0FIT7_9CHLO|nr:hypothetical protein CYMTET_30772 [Cymbomonas tetramitiformis]
MPSGADNFDQDDPKYWNRGMTLDQMQSEIDELTEVDANKYLYNTKFESWEVFKATFPSYCTEEALSHSWKALPVNFLSARACLAHEDEKRKFEAGNLNAGQVKNYLRRCAKEISTIPDVVRNYFYDAKLWREAQYGRYIDYAKIEGNRLGMASVAFEKDQGMVQSAGQRISYPDQYYDEYDEKLSGEEYRKVEKIRRESAKEEADREKELAARGRRKCLGVQSRIEGQPPKPP